MDDWGICHLSACHDPTRRCSYISGHSGQRPVAASLLLLLVAAAAALGPGTGLALSLCHLGG
jgi:hypothetical protein